MKNQIFSVATVVLGLSGLVSLLFLTSGHVTDSINIFLILVFAFLCVFFGVLFGLTIFLREAKRKHKKTISTAGLALGVINIFLTGHLIYFTYYPLVKSIRRSHNISNLGMALYVYSEKHSYQLPPASSWCSTLTEHLELPPDLLNYNLNRNVKYNYALNGNLSTIEKDVPGDTVLAFESNNGWNLVGGKELMHFDNYKGGCWVLFKNLNVSYVLPDETEKLKWDH